MSLRNNIYALFFLAVGCRPIATKSHLDTISNRPDWLNAKPVSSGYYVGIGYSNKLPGTNYIQLAKKNALEDIASAIKVNISSTSTLTQIEDYQSFTEKYEQITKTTTSDELQEYEQVDAWQDDTNYWVYYRLSKERYRQIREEKKNNAVAQALDFFTKAKQYEHKEKDVQAIAFYVKALKAVDRYLTQPLRVIYEGKEILPANEIYTAIQHLLSNIALSALPDNTVLNRRMARNTQEIIVRATRKNSSKPISGLPLSATFKKGGGDLLTHYETNAKGESKILITKITSKTTEQALGVTMDMLQFAGDSPTPIYALLVDRMIVPKVDITLKVERPVTYITTVENVMGKEKTTELASQTENYLTEAGFALTNNKNKAELWVAVKAQSEKGGVSGSLYAAYVTVAIKVVDLREKKEIYRATLNKVKDYSLDYQRAARAAYKKSLEKMEKTVLPELLDAILR